MWLHRHLAILISLIHITRHTLEEQLLSPFDHVLIAIRIVAGHILLKILKRAQQLLSVIRRSCNLAIILSKRIQRV